MTKWKLVPVEPDESQWGGLARKIIMAWDMGCDTPRNLFECLSASGTQIPQWLRDEPEMKNLDHVPSKGTRAAIIYLAMLEAAPEAPAVQPHQSEQHLEMVRDAERYRWLRDRMAFDSSQDGNHKMSLARPILATNHNFNTDFMGDRFDASVDAAIDAAMQAQKGGTQ